MVIAPALRAGLSGIAGSIPARLTMLTKKERKTLRKKKDIAEFLDEEEKKILRLPVNFISEFDLNIDADDGVFRFRIEGVFLDEEIQTRILNKLRNHKKY